MNKEIDVEIESVLNIPKMVEGYGQLKKENAELKKQLDIAGKRGQKLYSENAELKAEILSILQDSIVIKEAENEL
jgi:hypothetical protein